MAVRLGLGGHHKNLTESEQDDHLPGLKRELNRINGLVAKGDYYD